METSDIPLPPISSDYYSQVNKATEQVHVASQYLSMSGKFFLPNLPDDSHTNMGWNTEQQWFYSHPLLENRPIFLCLRPNDMHLLFVENDNAVLAEFPLADKTQQQGLEWVRAYALKLGINSAEYKIDLHYDMPPYADFAGQKFQNIPPEAFTAFSQLRTWGELIIAPFKNRFEHASPLRTWPHHFDHGTYIPLAFDEKGETIKSIGLGFAIHDHTIGEHYFYITPWEKNKTISKDELKALPHGYWNRKNFTGAVLPFSELLKIRVVAEQTAAAIAYMQAGINNSLELLSLT